MSKKRPEGVPAGAVWSEDDNEWVLGPRDEQGEFHGLVNYYRPDGTLCNTCPVVHGKPHGLSRRFHENGELSRTAVFKMGLLHGMSTWHACEGPEPTTEKMHAPGMSKEITRCQAEYQNGQMTEVHYFLASGEEVYADGSPCLKAPPGVPKAALYDPKSKQWVAGRWREDGKKQGLIRWWNKAGQLVAEETHDGDLLQGPVRHYHPGVGLRAETNYKNGQLHGPAAAYRKDGSLARQARFKENRYHGLLEDFDERGGVIRSVQFKDGRLTDRPRPRPAGADEESTPQIPGGAGDPYLLTRPAYSRPAIRPRMEDSQAFGILESLEFDEPEQQTISVKKLAEYSLGPAVLAELLAIGWTRLEDSDEAARASRLARKLFGQLAPRALWAKAVSLGLAAMPRIWNEKRLSQVVRGLSGHGSLDGEMLERSLLRRSGLGISMAFKAGAERAERALETATRDKKLNLRRRALTLLPAEVCHYPFLETIDLCDNRLTGLPPEIGDVWKLSSLDLGNNRIEKLPVELSRLTDLRKLDLQKNELAELPPGLIDLRLLTVLNLSYNRFKGLPDQIGDLEDLDHLWLNDNPLESLPPGFARLKKLRFLHLGGAQLEEIPECLFELEDLEELWVASSSFRFLSPEIRRIKALRRLTFWYSQVKSIPQELYSMEHIQEIRASHNPLPEGTLDRLKEAFPDASIF